MHDLILPFPVTYLAKTRQNLLCSAAVAEDAIDWSTLLWILPTLTGEEDVSAGRSRVLIA